jgi:hypothetical protein
MSGLGMGSAALRVDARLSGTPERMAGSDEIQLLPISFVTLLVYLLYKHTSVDLSSQLRYVPTLLIT